MNNISKRFLGWGLCLSLMLPFAGCSDDEEESPISGADAHIVSLTLTAVDGTVYPVSIVNDTLLLHLPNNISLEGATAAYKLCENSSILPDPATITNWDEEQVFRLVSYSGKEYAKYKYVIERDEVSSEGSVTLATQADLDAFGEKGINVINGNLIIGSSFSTDDPVMSLKGLSSLTKVNGKLIIQSSYEGGNLVGLENITELGGIMVGTEDAASTITTAINMNLPAVRKIGDIFINSNSIKTLQLPAITSASSICVTSSILDDVDFSNLQSCSGEFSFGRNASSSSMNSALKKLLCSNLKEIGGDFILQYMTALQEIDFENVAKVGGALKCANTVSLKKLCLPNLADFDGDLTLTSLTDAESINLSKIKTVKAYSVTGSSDWATTSFNISSLESVSGLFTHTAKMSNLEEFVIPALKSIGGNTTISTMANISSLSLPELEEIGGSLSLTTMTSVKSLSLPKLSSVKTTINVNLTEMESLDISSLTSFTQITLNSVKKMSELRFSESMSKCPGNITIAATCTSLKKIVGPTEYAGNITITLPTTSTVALGGDICIPVFESHSGEPVTIDGNLTVSATRATESHSINGVKQVVGKLTLPYCKEITVNDVTKVGSLTAGSYNGVVSKLSAPVLENVAGDFSINYRGMSSFYLPKLTSVGNFLLSSTKNYANSTLTNLDDFSALQAITGNVTIQYYTALTDYTGLSGVKNFSGKWTVANNKYNMTLEEFSTLCK